MSLPHHGENHESELMKLFREQQQGTANRQWPQGRISGADDGQLVYIIGPDPDGKNVIVQFPKPVAFIGLPPQEAIDLAQALIKHARAISTEPLRIVLH